MKNRHLLGVLAVAGTLLTATGCVATGSDGYYGDSGYGYGYSNPPPSSTIYVEGNRYDDRNYRDRQRWENERDRQRWEKERERDRQARDREARERERDRDRDRQARERDRDQRARDEDRRRELERQQRDRDRGRFGSSTGGQTHAQECEAMRRQNAAGSDTVITPSRPCR